MKFIHVGHTDDARCPFWHVGQCSVRDYLDSEDTLQRATGKPCLIHKPVGKGTCPLVSGDIHVSLTARSKAYAQGHRCR
jgi:hypothetical protein